MLPPPPTPALEPNPNFANLYRHLTENVLAHDGSTLLRTEEYLAATNRLTEARQSAARDEILLRALDEVSLKGSADEPESRLPRLASTAHVEPTPKRDHLALPHELRELVSNVTMYLAASLSPDASQTLPSDTDGLMADELATFHQHLPQISNALSAHLTDTESSLSATARSLSPSSTSTSKARSSRARPPDPSISLTTVLGSLQSSINTAQHKDLPKALNATAASLSSSSTCHASNIRSRIRHLELTTHGTWARHTSSRANYLSSVSRGIELKARIMGLEREKALYADQELMDRLEQESDALEVEKRKLTRQERELKALLGRYQAEGVQAVGRIGGGDGKGGRAEQGSGEDVFRVLGERYAEVETEIEEVKKDIERLETKAWRGR